jgi:acetylornithine deacetylase/succinyl-diaminopimelate desuccinylase-like protein
MAMRGWGRSPGALLEEIAAGSAVTRALAWSARSEAAFVEETIRIAEIPAPTFHEQARAAYAASRFRALGLERVEIAPCGNVYGLLPGDGPPAAAFIAHLDTVFPQDIVHTVHRRDDRLYGPGVGDNAAGLAGLLGAITALREAGARPARPIWVAGSVGEEGLGNLRGATAIADRLGGAVEAMVAVEGSFFGRLSHTAVGSRRLKISCSAPGGHSWHDFGRPSAVHALVRLAAALTSLRMPAEPRTTYNIGRIEGGSGVNVIAEEAHLLLDLRSTDAQALDEVSAQVHTLLAAHAVHDLELEAREVGFRPAGHLGQQHSLVQICASALHRLGMTPLYAPASTDANVPLSRGIPAVTLGVTRGGGAHTRGEWIETGPLVRGVQQLVLVAMALADPRAHLAPGKGSVPA